jgi:membrane protein DedA with SNARE-associated domain
VTLTQRDRIPDRLREAHERLEQVLPPAGRRRVAVIVGIVAAFVAVVISASRLLVLLFDGLDILAYIGLFVTNWVANGGLLVPVPGLRVVGWLMIVQQGGAFDAFVAGIVGGIAMALGQTTLYVAAASARGEAARHPSDHPSRLRSLASGRRAVEVRARLERLLEEHGTVTIIGVSLVPSPLTTLATGMAGAMGFGFRRFVLASLVGRIAFGLILASLGAAIMDLVAPGFHLPGGS